MSEINREQIIAALECCTHKRCDGHLDVKCEECPYEIGKEDCKDLDEQALALIKELNEEVADWKAIAEQYQKQFEDCYEEKEKIASEVAREIFAEIEQAIFAHGTKYAMKRLEELKKKIRGNGRWKIKNTSKIYLMIFINI